MTLLEQRNHNRLVVNLDVLVSDKMQRSYDFTVKNFGLDGLQLTCRDNEVIADSIQVNDLLDVNFDIEQQGIQNFHLEVVVVSISDNRLAVRLFNPALDAIFELSEKQEKEKTHNDSILISSLDKQSLDILQIIKHSFLKNLSHSVEIFLPVAHDDFFQSAEQSDNNSEQMKFFDAINTLNKSKDKLKVQFLKLMEDNFDFFGKQTKKEHQLAENEPQELDLIDQYEFENWLTVNQLIIEISPNHEQALSEIKHRLAVLFSVDDKKIEKTPFSPEVIFNEFSDVIHQYFLNDDVLLILYKRFEKVIDNHLAEIYKEINNIFISHDILPVIADKKYEIKKQDSAIEKITSPAENLSSDVSAQVPSASQPLSNNTIEPADTSQHQTELNTIKNDINLVPAYQTLKDLLNFQNGQGFTSNNDDFFLSDDYKQQLNLLINNLTVIQKKQAKDIETNGITEFELSSLVQECMNDDAYSIELKHEFEYTLDIIKRLFISISNDVWLGSPVKKLLLQLQVPLLKVSLLHKDFFESWSNPARMMINKLAIVHFDNEKDNFYINTCSLIVYLLEHFAEDMQLFSKSQKALDHLLKIQVSHYNDNVEKIIDNWSVQQIVIKELASRLTNRSMPVFIADFISNQWLSVLTSTYSNKGKESNQWQQYWQALDMLILSMSGDVSEEFIDSDVILFIIKQGLEENGQFNEKTFNNIESFLKNTNSDDSSVQLDYDIIFKLLINGYTLSDKKALLKVNEGVTDAAVMANNTIAKRLKINDYLVFKKDKQTKRIQLIWQSDSQYMFIFAGRNGKEAADINLMDMAAMLDRGQIEQTKEYDTPLLERSLYAIMGKIHDDLAEDSNVDKLTGLIRQNEFIRIFNEKLKQNIEVAHNCALCLINIDRFSLINDACSYDAGDKYIAEIAQLLKTNLNPDMILGRYGIDEFILLLPEYTIDKAAEVSELQRKLINDYTFKWLDKEFSLSASIGLVGVNKLHEPGILLKSVVTAATIAKEMGRNRVHFLEYDDIEFNHRQGLQLWATKVDQMLKTNQLNIRCQRLHPLHDNAVIQHYEMLLLINENGNYVPPGEFIEAAELYNKMQDVDRWVINYVFNWFSEHLEQLDIMGGIAINLSGQSLNDVNFIPFIKEIFARYPEVPLEKICFEITETMAITNMTYANNIIHTIKEMGCEFSLDDFGTGQSSYEYLKNLPVDYLKIDGVFIKDIVNNPADQAMVKSINEIGHFLGMKTVAEFVVNEEIINILKEIGVDYAQGYVIEKPMIITEFMKKSAFAAQLTA